MESSLFLCLHYHGMKPNQNIMQWPYRLQRRMHGWWSLSVSLKDDHIILCSLMWGSSLNSSWCCIWVLLTRDQLFFNCIKFKKKHSKQSDSGSSELKKRKVNVVYNFNQREKEIERSRKLILSLVLLTKERRRKNQLLNLERTTWQELFARRHSKKREARKRRRRDSSDSNEPEKKTFRRSRISSENNISFFKSNQMSLCSKQKVRSM
jgi:hypothetical protein